MFKIEDTDELGGIQQKQPLEVLSGADRQSPVCLHPVPGFQGVIFAVGLKVVSAWVLIGQAAGEFGAGPAFGKCHLREVG